MVVYVLCAYVRDEYMHVKSVWGSLDEAKREVLRMKDSGMYDGYVIYKAALGYEDSAKEVIDYSFS